MVFGQENVALSSRIVHARCRKTNFRKTHDFVRKRSHAAAVATQNDAPLYRYYTFNLFRSSVSCMRRGFKPHQIPFRLTQRAG